MSEVNFKLRNLLARGPSWTDAEWQIILDAIREKEGEMSEEVLNESWRRLREGKVTQFKVGDAVQTRDGRKARIVADDFNRDGEMLLVVAVGEPRGRLWAYHADGLNADGLKEDLNLVPAPRKHTVWVKLRRGDFGVYPEPWPTNPSRPLASDVVACIKLEIEEGRFDQE